MSLVSLREMLNKGLEEQYAVGHFNLNNLEFTQAILQAAQEEESPVILAVSPGYIAHLGGLKLASSLVRAALEEYRITVPVALHLDHGMSFEQCLQAIQAGFTSVMIDASHEPLEENIRMTKQVVDAAHALGVSVEAELGRIAGQEDHVIVNEAEAMHAIPEECARLVRETGVDCLAPALGSVHGPYKGEPNLSFTRMKEVQEMIGIPLVLHGGTGIGIQDIKKAISLGTAKINVNTENQMAYSEAIRAVLKSNANLYDPREYIAAGREAVKDTVKRKMREFGSSGKA